MSLQEERDMPDITSPSSSQDAAEGARFLDITTPPHIITLVLMAGIGALNMNVLLPSLPAMTAALDTQYTIMQLAISAYLAMTAVVQIFIGPLSDRFGRRPVIIASCCVFLAATAAAAFATTVETFLFFRLVQASIVGGLALSRAIVRDMVPMEKAASMIGYVTMGMSLVPMIAPAIGGILQESFGWQSVQWFAFAAGAIVLLIVLFDLKETNNHQSASMVAQFQAYPELFASRRFWGFVASSTFASGMFFAFLGGAPYVAERHLNLSPSQLGLYFAFIALGYMVGNFFSGRYAQRFGIFPMMLSGGGVAVTGATLAALWFSIGLSNALGFFLPLFFVGMGNGMVLPSAMAGMVSVRPHLAGSAAGLGGAMQIGGGAGLSAWAGYLLTPQSGPLPLLLLMMAAGIAGIAAMLYTRHVAKTVERAANSG